MPLITNGTTVKSLIVNGTTCKEAYANGTKVFSSYEPWNLCSLDTGTLRGMLSIGAGSGFLSGGNGGTIYVECNATSDGSYARIADIYLTIPAWRVGDANRITYTAGLSGNTSGQGDYLNINGTHIVSDGVRSGSMAITPNQAVQLYWDRIFYYGMWGSEATWAYISNLTFSQE